MTLVTKTYDSIAQYWEDIYIKTNNSIREDFVLFKSYEISITLALSFMMSPAEQEY